MNKVIITIIMKYRSKNDIIGHILEAVNSSGDNGLTKTKIMYGIFLSILCSVAKIPVSSIRKRLDKKASKRTGRR
jgi:predicted transcriptional regulator